MATITKIEEQKNKKRVNIFVDDAFFCGLLKETAVIFALKVGKTVEPETLNKAVFESEVKRAFEKSMDYLSSRMYSSKEISDKLLKKSFEKDVCQKAVEKLREYKYIDDELFAKQFIEQNKRYSKLMIENKLKTKGISNSIINAVFSEFDDGNEYEICKKLAEKYAKSHDVISKEGKQKLFVSLARKGFGFDLIKSATKDITSYDEDWFSDKIKD